MGQEMDCSKTKRWEDQSQWGTYQHASNREMSLVKHEKHTSLNNRQTKGKRIKKALLLTYKGAEDTEHIRGQLTEQITGSGCWTAHHKEDEAIARVLGVK